MTDDTNDIADPDAQFECVLDTSDAAALQFAKEMLEAEGIEADIRHASFSADVTAGAPAALMGAATQNEPSELLVRVADADRARALLAQAGAAGVPAADALPALSRAETITLTDAETGGHIGRISEADLQFLMDQLEEESDADQDYYFDRPTIEMLAGAGARAGLVDLLRRALGSRDGAEIRWSRQ